MKKLLFVTVVFLTLCFSATAQRQGKDGFFNDWNDVSNGLGRTNNVELPPLPGNHGYGGDVYVNPSPLGSGLLILAALGGAYAVAKRKRE